MKKTLAKIIAIAAVLLIVSCKPEPELEPEPAADPLNYGNPVSVCQIVYEALDGGRIDNCANVLKYELDSLATVKLSKSTESYSSESEEGKLLIYIGNTGSAESIAAAKTFYTPMDYTISIRDGKAVILGYTSFATAAATEKFIEIVNDNPRILSCTDYTYSYYFDLRNISPLCWDCSDFQPNWTRFYDQPAWMGNMHEKMYAVTHYDVPRPVIYAHRGDFTYYPSGSVEGVLSACMAGVDAIEIDFRLTKDNIPVTIHEEDLRYLTDVEQKKGKNGLPDSYYVGDWTYDQLRQLNLIKGANGNTYKIATCYEALLVARHYGTLLTWDDKADDTKVKTFAATDHTTLSDMLPLMLNTDTYHYFLVYYCLFGGYTKKLSQLDVPGTSETFRTYFDFWKTCVQDTLSSHSSLPKPKGPWELEENWEYAKQQESEYWWEKWFDEGYSRLWTNSCIAFSNYVANNYGPCDYMSIM